MPYEKLIGRWDLVDHQVVSSDAEARPTGPVLKGLLIYEAQGAMAVVITFQEKCEGPRDFVSYAGTYSIEGTTITHHIEVCPTAARVGTGELREATLEGNLLHLRTPQTPSGYALITWRKAHESERARGAVT